MTAFPVRATNRAILPVLWRTPLQGRFTPPTVKQHLAAIRMLFDWLVTGQVIAANPAHAVRGPKYVVKKGKTPILDAAETRALTVRLDAKTSAMGGCRHTEGGAVISCSTQTCSLSPIYGARHFAPTWIAQSDSPVAMPGWQICDRTVVSSALRLGPRQSP